MPPHPVYDRRLPDQRLLGAVILEPLDQQGVQPVVVDVGARNGFLLLPPAYTERATMIGFEPNPVEYQKLVGGTTDAGKWHAAQGIEVPQFKDEKYFPYALWDKSERRKLYITRGAGACTLMGETTPIARNIYFRHPKGDPRRNASFHDVQTEVMSAEEMGCRPLDELLVEGETVDFLKIDVEGAELRVLKGAEKLLRERRILCIRTEFQLVPYYVEHPLLCDQHRFLEDHGFRLVDLEFAHARYRRGHTDLPDKSDPGMPIAGDALFALDPDRLDLSPLQRHRIGVLSMALGQPGFGFSLLEEARLLSGADLAALTAAMAAPPARSLQGRLLDAWQAFPYRVRDLLYSLRRRMRAAGPR